MSLLDDVLQFLTDEALIGGDTGWTGAASYLPPSPDKVIAVFDAGGPPPVLVPLGSTEERLDEPLFQVRGRAGKFDYEILRQKMEAIYLALHESELGDTDGYLLVRAENPAPLPLGLDGSDRPGLTWNFTAIRRRPAP